MKHGQKYSNEQLTELIEKMPGKPSQNADALARICGVERYVSFDENTGYRGADLASKLISAIEERDRAESSKLAILNQNLESIVHKQNDENEQQNDIFTYLKAIGNFIGKSTIYGMLPRSWQEKIAKRNNEHAEKYTFLSSIVVIIGTIGLMDYSERMHNPLLGLISYGLCITESIRMPTLLMNHTVFGHPIMTLPYHAVRLSYNGIKSLSRFITKKYEPKKQLGSMQSQKIELPQLPPPESFTISISNGELEVINSEGNNLLDKAIEGTRR